MFIAVLPLIVLFQVLPPPAGRVATVVLLHGMGGARDLAVTVPAPSSPALPEDHDCRCGIPNSPRGPR